MTEDEARRLAILEKAVQVGSMLTGWLMDAGEVNVAKFQHQVNVEMAVTVAKARKHDNRNVRDSPFRGDARPDGA